MRVSGNSTLTDAQGKAFGAEMRRLRTEAKMTTTEFAKYIGITPAYACQLEKANRKPSPQLAGRIADAFNITVDDMLASDDDRDDRIRDFRIKYGATLKKHRIEKCLPCSAVAGALGIPTAVYKEYEEGACSITERNMELLNRVLGIGEKPKVETVEVKVEIPAEIPTGICDTILAHVKDLQISDDEQKEVWRYFSKVRLYAEERKLFG